MNGIFPHQLYLSSKSKVSPFEKLAPPTIEVTNIGTKTATVIFSVSNGGLGLSYLLSVNNGVPIQITSPYSLTGLSSETNYTLKAIAMAVGYRDSDEATKTFTTSNIPQEPTVINLTPADAFYNSKVAGQQPINPQPAVNAFSTYKFNIDGVNEVTLGLYSNNRDGSYYTGEAAVYIDDEIIGHYQPSAFSATENFAVNTSGKSGVLRVRMASTQRSYEQGSMFSNELTRIASSSGLLQKITPSTEDIVAIFITNSIGVGVGPRHPASESYGALLAEFFKNISFFFPGYGSKQAYAQFTENNALQALTAEITRATATAQKVLIFFSLGINDSLAETASPSDLKTIYQTGLNTLKASFPNAIFVVLTPWTTLQEGTTNKFGATNQDYRNTIMQLTSVTKYDMGNALAPDDFLNDPIHFRTSGHLKAFNLLKPIVQSLL